MKSFKLIEGNIHAKILLKLSGVRECYIPLQTERRGMDIPSTFSEAQPRRMYEEYSCLSDLSVKEYHSFQF